MKFQVGPVFSGQVSAVVRTGCFEVDNENSCHVILLIMELVRREDNFAREIAAFSD